MSGFEFNRLARKNGWILVKYLKSNNFGQPMPEHHNYIYKKGELNRVINVCLDPEKPCSEGGLYFTYFGNFLEMFWWYEMKFCFHVLIPDTARVLIEKTHKFKTTEFVLLDEVNDQYYAHLIQETKSYKYVVNLKDIRPYKDLCYNALLIYPNLILEIQDPTLPMYVWTVQHLCTLRESLTICDLLVVIIERVIVVIEYISASYQAKLLTRMLDVDLKAARWLKTKALAEKAVIYNYKCYKLLPGRFKIPSIWKFYVCGYLEDKFSIARDLQ